MASPETVRDDDADGEGRVGRIGTMATTGVSRATRMPRQNATIRPPVSPPGDGDLSRYASLTAIEETPLLDAICGSGSRTNGHLISRNTIYGPLSTEQPDVFEFSPQASIAVKYRVSRPTGGVDVWLVLSEHLVDRYRLPREVPVRFNSPSVGV